MRKSYYLLIIGLIFIVMTSLQKKEKVDLIVHNSIAYTVDDKFTTVSAFAVKDGKFVAMGSDTRILNDYSSSNIVDAKGKFIYPGFNDGHSHFTGYGFSKTKYANLVGTKSFDEVIERLIAHHKKYPGEWVLGRGWDQNDWKDKDFPTNKKLNDAFPKNPVFLTRIDGHASIVNAKALEIAGVNASKKINGGEILMEKGRPTGVLIDNAMDLFNGKIPPSSSEETVKALLKAQQDCFAVGLTTVTDAGQSKKVIELMEELHESGELKMRIYAMLNPSKENFGYFLPQGPIRTEKLTVSSIKLYIDGALGSRGALLLKPYSDDPDNHGLQMQPDKYYNEVCNKAYKAGYQVNTHAIGDSGNRIMLKTYAKFLKGPNDLRWRVEHAQVVFPKDLGYFVKYSIIPSIQSTHCTSDMYWADERLGEERVKTAYAYADLLKQNGWLVNGTDFPVEDISPLKTFYAAVARMDEKGWPKGGFQMENALSREDALRSITIWPAKGSFDENIKGSIEKGKLADFVILDEDLMKVDAKKIPDIKILATYLDGEAVYQLK